MLNQVKNLIYKVKTQIINMFKILKYMRDNVYKSLSDIYHI